MNGDHNNMGYVIKGYYKHAIKTDLKKKPIVIYLDFHSDARRLADAPHSGTWISECCD